MTVVVQGEQVQVEALREAESKERLTQQTHMDNPLIRCLQAAFYSGRRERHETGVEHEERP